MLPCIDNTVVGKSLQTVKLSAELMLQATYQGFRIEAIKGLSDESYSVNFGRSENYKISRSHRALMKKTLQEVQSQRVVDRNKNDVILELHSIGDRCLAGFVSLKKTPDCKPSELWLSKLAVAPGFQGKKLGSYLCDCAMDYAEKTGISTLKLQAARDVVGFYQRKGMKVVIDGGGSSLLEVHASIKPASKRENSVSSYLDLAIPNNSQISRDIPFKELG